MTDFRTTKKFGSGGTGSDGYDVYLNRVDGTNSLVAKDVNDMANSIAETQKVLVDGYAYDKLQPLAFSMSVNNQAMVYDTGTSRMTKKTVITTADTGSVTSTMIFDGTIVNVDINASAAIDASKIADGSVSSAEFQFINSLTSNAQTQIDSKVAKAGDTMSGNLAMGGNKVTGLGSPTANGEALRYDQLGVASGIATLDGGGKVPASQLPSAVMTYEGVWNASTNSPSLANGTGDAGMVYRVGTAGSQFAITFDVGDYVIYNGTVWEKSDTTDAVASVNGTTGIVTVNAINQLTGDITASAASGSQSKATTVAAIAGTTVSGTTGTGNVAFSASPTFTGTVVLPSGQALIAPALGTPASGVMTSVTGLPLTTGVTGILPNANTTATSANTASAIVARDGSGNFTAGTITAALTGNASTATLAATVTTNANLTGVVTSFGNLTSIANAAITNAMLANSAVANLSGTNTGDNATNTLYSGLVSNATHTGDATGATALTLATVNSNVGSFGSATQVMTQTVNAKGLTTAAANVNIQMASSTANGFLLATGSLYRLHIVTSNGYGSTNAGIRRFSTTLFETGTGATYADSASAGMTITISTAGVYAFTYSDQFGAIAHFGISKNSTQLATNIVLIDQSHRLVANLAALANGMSACAATVFCNVGDVIRAHTDGAAGSDVVRASFICQRLN